MTEHQQARICGRIKAFRYAIRGIGLLLTHHVHGRIHAVAAVLTILLGAWFRIERAEWMAVALSIGLVLAAEAINSALEELADALHPGHHPAIGRAKDLAAGGVLAASIAAAAVGGLVFVPRLLAL
ncbi:MAG: diacylglycerol kinase family protein [Kiritimatiellae bacterium]|nr:diacylglycerol kinase family protein [Kiritimatiellia bacterium]MDW8459059.1 diacylglycerol kinase family protein [Verrucomicrobiota bacterium]